MTVTVRFAPSPTGFLHIGNARTALYNALLARREGGQFILRLDDTDLERSEQRFAEAIERDLEWLGIAPDRLERQSDRLTRYDDVAADLKARGLLYPCYETADELEQKRRRQRARGLPPIYDRAALRLSAAQRRQLEAEGRRPHFRFRLPAEPGDQSAVVTFQDLCRGPQSVTLGALSDPVLIREDGSYLYTLSSVVDDADFAITDVLRGDDHITNTGVQIAIFEAIGAGPPRFGHHNLLIRDDGEMLSKRGGSLSLSAMREDGIEPMAVASLAVLLGTAMAVEAIADLDALAARLDLSQISRSPARFSPDEILRLNAELLHAMPYRQAAPRLRARGIAGEEPFWLAVRGNLTRFADVDEWWRVIEGPIEAAADDDERTYLAAAARLLPDGPITTDTFGAWTRTLKAETGRRGKSLFLPLRRALTGREQGPELAQLLPLLGRQKIADRLRAP